ncbi:MAG: hypothetical protein L0I24_17025 [Pseudonocardia sp.]|nr:hypothetical protein [Pseudonocardia sp.]
MLPFPLIVRTVGGGLSDDRAYLWHTPAQVQPPQPVIQPAAVARTLRHLLTATAPDGRLPTAEVRDAMRVTSFMDAHGSVRPPTASATWPPWARRPGPRCRPLLADSTRTLPFQPHDQPGTGNTGGSCGCTRCASWYPSEQRHKILYRGPYVKGPADKPLLGGDVARSMT